MKMNVTNRSEKVDYEWGHLSSFHASFLGYGPLIVQKSEFSTMHFRLIKRIFN